MVRNIFSRWLNTVKNNPQKRPQLYEADEHRISPAKVSRAARAVVETLTEGGFEAYIVGGGVRDLMLGLQPKDFDVATNALPEEVRTLFDRCRIIGRRFRLAHVHVGRERIEVATFRGGHHSRSGREHLSVTLGGRILRDNAYGPIDRDAERRDFTVNSLFYDPSRNVVLDFVGGVKDLRRRQLRMIGKPATRFREDPVRLLRVVRFSAKLGFEIDSGMAHMIPDQVSLLEAVSPARLFDEGVKLLHCGAAEKTLDLLCETGLLGQLFPPTAAVLKNGGEEHLAFLRRALANTDNRARNGQSLSPAFAYAIMMWPSVCHKLSEMEGHEIDRQDALHLCGERVVNQQMNIIRIPYRHAQMIREIWVRQVQLEAGPRSHPERVINRGYFRAAYDFLGLRAQPGDALQRAHQAWTEAQERGDSTPKDAAPRRRRRRRK